MLAPAALGQESSPPDFDLPSPSPTPTSRPEGPADERAGVPIPPRVIPQRSQPALPPLELPLATPTPTPLPRALAEPAVDDAPARIAPAPRNDPAPAPSLSEEPAETGEGFLVGEGEWVDIEPGFDDAGTGLALPGDAANAQGQPPSTRQAAIPDAWLWALVALLIGGLAGAAWLARRARQPSPAAGDLTKGLRETIRARPAHSSLAPAPHSARPLHNGDSEDATIGPDAEPLAIELSLEIVRATRSVMTFSLEYRLMLWNRSERAARDLELHTRLVCAKRAGATSLSSHADSPLATIERIGPHQRRTVSATLQLPLSEIEAMHQGAKPLFVPLLQVMIERPGSFPIERSFVIGSPSIATGQAGPAKLHPIPLDTPPGGIAGLCASEIRHRTPVEPA